MYGIIDTAVIANVGWVERPLLYKWEVEGSQLLPACITERPAYATKTMTSPKSFPQILYSAPSIDESLNYSNLDRYGVLIWLLRILGN